MTVYGYPKEEGVLNQDTPFKKYAETLEKNKCKLIFWAGAYGVAEPLMYVVKFNDIKDWETAGLEIFQDNPLKDTRTVFGWDFVS